MKPFSIEKAVRDRYSVRTYDKQKVDHSVRDQIMDYAASLENPLGPKVRFKWIDKSVVPEGGKLGTYGIIRGAELYIGTAVPEDECAMEALGYDFEHLVLYMTSLGLGTCWLGGTFNRGAFADAMGLEEGELFPIVSPVGYPAKKRSLVESIMRKGAGADKRLPWEQMFFNNDFSTPLSKDEAGEYGYALEMVRLGPSAVNRQPWRIIRKDGVYHFYEKHTREGEEPGVIDMHRIDLGIAICHFHLALQEKGLSGRFEKLDTGDIELPGNMTYITSWIPE